MIKLIVSDVDGTLIRHFGEMSVPSTAFQMIERCHQHDIQFAVASGRQYNNLKRLFAPVWKDLYFIPDNGNLLLYQEELLHQVAFPTQLAQDLLHYLKEIDECVFMAASPFSVFILDNEHHRWFADRIIYDVKYTATMIPSVDYLVNEDIVKVAVYADLEHKDALTEKFTKDWGYHLKVTQSGGRWIDFSLSGKGAAVRRLSDDLGIDRSEIMVFGDNYNDEEMLIAADHSYAMAGADDYLKTVAAYTAHSVEQVVNHYLDTGDILKQPK